MHLFSVFRRKTLSMMSVLCRPSHSLRPRTETLKPSSTDPELKLQALSRLGHFLTQEAIESALHRFQKEAGEMGLGFWPGSCKVFTRFPGLRVRGFSYP